MAAEAEAEEPEFSAAVGDPYAQSFDPDDPKARQQAIPEVETFAEYLARRNAAAARQPDRAREPPPADR